MATLLRPPLVSQPQVKRPIGSVDAPARLLGLYAGVLPTPPGARLFDSATQRCQSQSLFSPVNLLTLSTVAPAIPSGRQWSDSAPRKAWLDLGQPIQGFIVDSGPDAAILQLSDSAPVRRSLLSVDRYTNLLTATLVVSSAAPFSAIRMDWSAPRNTAVSFEIPQNALTLQPVPKVQRLDAGASYPKAQIRIDAYSNLSTTTLAPIPAIARLDQGAPSLKNQVRVDAYSNITVTTLSLTGIALPVSAGRLDASAPWVKTAYRIDQPMIRSVALDPVPKVQRLDQPAPWVKYRPQVDTYPDNAILGFTPIRPAVNSLTNSAPPGKPQVFAQQFLNVGGLYAPPAVLGAPLGYPNDFGSWQVKYTVLADAYSNAITLGSATVTPVTAVSIGRSRLMMRTASISLQMSEGETSLRAKN